MSAVEQRKSGKQLKAAPATSTSKVSASTDALKELKRVARRVKRNAARAMREPTLGDVQRLAAAALPKEPPDPTLTRLMADVPGALRTAIEAINEATIAAQELETIADEGGVPQDEDFAPLYRALRSARSHVRLVVGDYLDELGAVIGVPPRSEEDEAAAIAVIQASNVEKFGKVVP